MMLLTDNYDYAGVLLTGRRDYVPWVLLICIWLLMLTCFTLPGRPTPLGASSLDWVGLLKLFVRVATTGLLTIVLWLSWSLPSRRSVFVSLLPMSLFVVWAFVSALWSPLWQVTVGQATGLLAQVLLAASVGLHCRSSGSLSSTLCSLSLATLTAGTLILMISLVFPKYGGFDRLNPGIIHPTTSAATASLGILLLVACRLQWGWRWTRLLLWPGLAVLIPLLILAANRATLVLTVLLTVWVLLFFSGRHVLLLLLLVGIVSALSYMMLDPVREFIHMAFASFQHYFKRGAMSLDNFSGRTEMWQTIWTSYLESPWIGHGYSVTSARGEIYVWHKWANWTAHNAFLQALASTGAIGAALLICGIAVPTLRMLCRWGVRGCHGATTRFLLLFGVWYMVWWLLNESIMGPVGPDSVTFFTLMGIAVGLI